MIIGTGPAGSSSAALLSSYGVENMVINRYRWLANTPRTHITNQRTMEVLRDLGKGVEAEVARQPVGDPELEIELLSANTWTVNDTYAE